MKNIEIFCQLVEQQRQFVVDLNGILHSNDLANQLAELIVKLSKEVSFQQKMIQEVYWPNSNQINQAK